MQSIDHLTDSLAMQIASNRKKEGHWCFSKIDLKYAYSQTPLDNSIAEHCNFNILGGKATGTYRFINGFYGLTDIPATLQKNNRQNSRRMLKLLCIPRRHPNRNKRETKSTRRKPGHNTRQIKQGRSSYQLTKMRICQTKNRMARI